MIAESETFIPVNSILVGMTKDQIEKKYKIKVLATSYFLNPDSNIHVEGEWDNVARFEKDLFCLVSPKRANPCNNIARITTKSTTKRTISKKR
jgi:hypothetical protein